MNNADPLRRFAVLNKKLEPIDLRGELAGCAGHVDEHLRMVHSANGRDGRPMRNLSAATRLYHAPRSETTLPCSLGAVARNSAHASISRRRLSNRSPRRYAASTLLPTACASAISTTSLGKLVRSAAQSRKLDRKPCTVMSLRPMRRSTAAIPMLDSGLFRLPPGNT